MYPSRARFGCLPGGYAEGLGWTAPDVWHTPCVTLNEGEANLFDGRGQGWRIVRVSTARWGRKLRPSAPCGMGGVKVG